MVLEEPAETLKEKIKILEDVSTYGDSEHVDVRADEMYHRLCLGVKEIGLEKYADIIEIAESTYSEAMRNEIEGKSPLKVATGILKATLQLKKIFAQDYGLDYLFHFPRYPEPEKMIEHIASELYVHTKSFINKTINEPKSSNLQKANTLYNESNSKKRMNGELEQIASGFIQATMELDNIIFSEYRRV